MKQNNSKRKALIPSGIWCITSVVVLFGYLGMVMGVPNMLNTIMRTAHDLLLNTVFYLMSICVITGAIGRVFVEFGVVTLLERTLRPLMRPIFNLPGVTSLGAVMTFLSDNPAIISLAHDKRFASYFKKYQFISLTNFGTAFGMGLLVIVFMASQGYYAAPLIGLLGACLGCVCSTRLMQRFVLKAYPQYATEDAVSKEDIEEEEKEEGVQEEKTVFIRLLNAMLDGGRSGVEVGIAIIPGVLIISTFVMIFTFGASADGSYTGAAYQGVELLPWLANKIDFVFEWLFGFHDPHLVAFPITALGAVGAALSLIPNFIAHGWIDGNAIAVFTAIGMCWSGSAPTPPCSTRSATATSRRRLSSPTSAADSSLPSPPTGCSSSTRWRWDKTCKTNNKQGWQIGSFAESASLLTTRTHSHVNWCALLFNRISLVYLLFYLNILNRKPLFSWLYCFFSFESVHTLIAFRSASVALRKFL